jgi:hypothetical protein
MTNKIAAAAAAGLISAACGGNTPEAEAPAGDSSAMPSDSGEAAGDGAQKEESCKGEEGCEHKGECKGEEKCKGGEECKGKESCDGHAPE